jgi:hypothetical protein
MRRCLVVCVGLLAAAGCSKPGRTPLFGRVSVGGQAVNAGEIRFVPIDDDGRGPAKFTTYVSIQADGTYRCENLGGIPPGRYRVEVEARRKTGRTVKKQDEGGEVWEVDETNPAGAKAYAGPTSPLILYTETTPATGQFDIEVPAS